MNLYKLFSFVALIIAISPLNIYAADQVVNNVAAIPLQYDSIFTINNLWLLIATFLVFMMQFRVCYT